MAKVPVNRVSSLMALGGGLGPSRPLRRSNIVCKVDFFVFESKILAFLFGSH